MKYFVSKEVKLVTKEEIFNGACTKDGEKAGIQVAKNSFESGKEISDILQKNGTHSHILADSDRCCIDWVAVSHAQPDFIIKRSFSCPLLNTTRSRKIAHTYPVYQYIPEPTLQLNSTESTNQCSSSTTDALSSCTVYLAVDVLYTSQYAEIKEHLESITQTAIKDWSYQEKVEENHAILVLSDNEGFISYFTENYSCILLGRETLQSRDKTMKQIENEVCMEQKRAKMLISKMALADTLKRAERIGVVFTSADHMDLIDVISKYLDMNNKKFYQFYINGLKPNKLGNFVGIDAFVVIQCPFSSFRFEENIIALRPYDLLLAFRSEWSGEYSTNLEVAMEEITKEIAKEQNKEELGEEQTSMLQIKSSINTLRLAKNEVCTREQAQRYFQTGEYMKSVSGIMIEENVKENANDELVQGYSGIPTEYTKK
ncbi:diphthamide biosynthesis protein 2 [Nematocida minor]|uniref:diphthamide biosynthesis protein 2 n=1 Tax=Nematocida minor TaxID=1912983 RepID=UPI00221F4733|nr:diphthamide biosynthesis protein 2 [Nematocida minor]KAI5189877.1 diphthamide biosynthesis protein 2 [Nematocida minor]